MTDLVDRLRAEGALAGHYDAPAIQREAAAEITRLRAERAILELEAHDARKDRDAARTEAEQLRAALQTAADALQEAGCTYGWAAAHAALLRGAT